VGSVGAAEVDVVQVGEMAPEVRGVSQSGQDFALSALRGQKTVVVFFYPRDGTPGCTQEACAFRDAFEAFTDAGAVVVGVSQDDVASHGSFAAAHRLPFQLIADVDGGIRKSWDVPRSLVFLPGRATYVVDRAGIVRHIFVSQLNVTRHVDEALAVVRSLTQPAAAADGGSR